ncbi:MAG: EamA family transporter, partial [bacterium]|nr:EamA family transporter [bacterium]
MSNIKKILGLVFLCIAWGTSFVAIKVTLEGFPPLFGAAARFLSAVVMLYIYIKWKRIPLRLTTREFRILLFTAFLIYAGDYGLIYWGEQYLSAGVASIFFAPFTMFT